MNARAVVDVIEQVSPIASGMRGDELGFIFGSPENKVSGVAVCWSPTHAVIRAAERAGCNLIICHEPLFYQRRWSMDAEAKNVWFDEADDEEKRINRVRKAALDAFGGCVYRAHSNWDVVPGIGVLDALAAAFELGEPLRRGRFTAVYAIKPATLDALARRVQRTLNTGPIRVLGQGERVVRSLGLLIGGLGQMFNSPEEVVSLGAEAVIAGECLEYTLRHALELELAVIEAGHCASENPGMRALARFLQEKLPRVKVLFVDSGTPWRYIVPEGG